MDQLLYLVLLIAASVFLLKRFNKRSDKTNDEEN